MTISNELFTSPAAVVLKNDELYLIINPNIMSKLSTESKVAILIHEAMHLLNKHLERSILYEGAIQKTDPNAMLDRFIWNLAADHVINVAIRNAFNVPKEWIDMSFIIDKIADKNWITEHVYEYIKNNNNLNATLGYIKIRTENGESIKIPVARIKGKIADKDIDTIIPISETKNIKVVKEKLEELRNDASVVHNKYRGLLPGSVSTLLDKFLKTEIPWDKVLENVIASKVTKSIEERRWIIPNIYFRHLFKSPGYDNSESKYDTAFIITDTSGSISDNQLKRFADIICQSAKYFDTIIVIQHDADIQDTRLFELDGINNVELLRSYLINIEFKGRGGTSHIPPFKLIQDIIDGNYDKIDINCEPSIVISLTDAHSDIHEAVNRVQWPEYVPLVFILTEDYSESGVPDRFTKIVMKESS